MNGEKMGSVTQLCKQQRACRLNVSGTPKLNLHTILPPIGPLFYVQLKQYWIISLINAFWFARPDQFGGERFKDVS